MTSALDDGGRLPGESEVNDLNMPEDLVSFLKANKRLDYDPASCEAGLITLKPLEKLEVELFPMSPPDEDEVGSFLSRKARAFWKWLRRRSDDEEEYGSFLVRGVSLIESCDAYDPHGLLLWLPLERQYGLWDGEHGALLVFGPSVTWKRISAKLPHYLNAGWGLEGSARVSSLNPRNRHPYNRFQTCKSLPLGKDWYEAEWTRRGKVDHGIPIRYPEQIKIRLEREGDRCQAISQFQRSEPDAEWSEPETRVISLQEWQELQPWLESQFWNLPSTDPNPDWGETETMWSISGFRAIEYHTLFRSYSENRGDGDPVNELGTRLARLVKLWPRAGDDPDSDIQTAG